MTLNSSKRLKLIREAIGNKSQAQLASEMGIPLHKIKSVEAGKTKIAIEIALILEEKFNLSFRWVLAGRGKMFNHENSSYLNETGLSIDSDILEEILIGIEVSLQQIGEKLSSQSRAQLIAMLYQMRTDPEVISMGYSTELELATIRSFLNVSIDHERKKLQEDETLKDDIFLNPSKGLKSE